MQVKNKRYKKNNVEKILVMKACIYRENNFIIILWRTEFEVARDL